MLSFGPLDIEKIRNISLPYFLIAEILYLPVVFGLQYLMNRQKTETKKYVSKLLKVPFIFWNLSLSLISTIGAFFLLKHVLYGKYDCSVNEGITGIWLTVFYLSKIPELLDTVFIVLMSKKLVVLQWYHHIATLLLTHLGFYILPIQTLDAALINYSIHAIMYCYFAVCIAGFTWLRRYSKYITYTQVGQMIYMTVMLAIRILRGESYCYPVDDTIGFILKPAAVGIYFTYIILFGQLLLKKKND